MSKKSSEDSRSSKSELEVMLCFLISKFGVGQGGLCDCGGDSLAIGLAFYLYR
jgi:hypothetical protein